MKITRITARNWLGRTDIDMDFRSEAGVEAITGPTACGKTLLTRYIFDLCAGRRSPYTFDETHFDSLAVEFDGGEVRSYSPHPEYSGVPVCNWRGHVPGIPASYMNLHDMFRPHYGIGHLLEAYNEEMKKYRDICGGEFSFAVDGDGYLIVRHDGRKIEEPHYLSNGQIKFLSIMTSLI